MLSVAPGALRLRHHGFVFAGTARHAGILDKVTARRTEQRPVSLGFAGGLPERLQQRPAVGDRSNPGEIIYPRARQTVGDSAELGVSAEVQGSDAVRIRVLHEQLTGTGLTDQPARSFASHGLPHSRAAVPGARGVGFYSP